MEEEMKNRVWKGLFVLLFAIAIFAILTQFKSWEGKVGGVVTMIVVAIMCWNTLFPKNGGMKSIAWPIMLLPAGQLPPEWSVGVITVVVLTIFMATSIFGLAWRYRSGGGK